MSHTYDPRHCLIDPLTGEQVLRVEEIEAIITILEEVKSQSQINDGSINADIQELKDKQG